MLIVEIKKDCTVLQLLVEQESGGLNMKSIS